MQPAASPPDDRTALADAAQEALTAAQATGDLGELEHAIMLFRTLVATMPATASDRATGETGLAAALATRFDLRGEPGDLDRAIVLGRRARRRVAADDPALALIDSNLGGALATRFMDRHRPADLRAAIAALRSAVAVASDADPYLAIYHSNLGAGLELAFSLGGASDALDDAVAHARRAVEHTPPGAPRHALGGYRANLANVLLVRFRNRGDASDLDDALAQCGRLEVVLPDDHAERPAILARAGDAWTLAYLFRGGTDALDRAVDLHRQAWARHRPVTPITRRRLPSWPRACARASSTPAGPPIWPMPRPPHGTPYRRHRRAAAAAAQQPRRGPCACGSWQPAGSPTSTPR